MGFTQNITQFHFMKWPKLKVPDRSGPILTLAKDLRQEVLSLKKDDCTVLVHCSDGSGRTGTFIALYHLMENMDQRLSQEFLVMRDRDSGRYLPDELVKNTVDVFDTVFTLRSRRASMVGHILKM